MIWFPVFPWKKFNMLCQTLTTSSLKFGDPLLNTFKVINFITSVIYYSHGWNKAFIHSFIHSSPGLVTLDCITLSHSVLYWLHCALYNQLSPWPLLILTSLDSVLDFKSYLCILDLVRGLTCITVIFSCLKVFKNKKRGIMVHVIMIMLVCFLFCLNIFYSSGLRWIIYQLYKVLKTFPLAKPFHVGKWIGPLFSIK